MAKLRIAVVFPKDSEAFFNQGSTETFGGANVQMYLIAKELNNHSEVETLSFICDYNVIDFADKDRFTLVKTFSRKDPILVKVFKFTKQLVHQHPGVVIQHGLTIFSCVLALVCRVLGIKFVFMLAQDREAEGRYQYSGKKCTLFKMLLSNSFKLIAQNQLQKDTLWKKFRVESAIIRNGFELVEMKPNTQKEYILWVARHDEVKQPDIFIELAKQCNKYQFVMVCPKIPQDLEADYQAFVERARSVKNLQFVSYVPFSEIDEYFRGAKIVVNTSMFEGFPQVFIQAALYAVPLLSLSVDPDHFITRLGCGIVCNNQFTNLKSGLDSLMKDEGLYSQCADAIYRYAQEYHDIKKNVNELLASI